MAVLKTPLLLVNPSLAGAHSAQPIQCQRDVSRLRAHGSALLLEHTPDTVNVRCKAGGTNFGTLVLGRIDVDIWHLLQTNTQLQNFGD